MSSASVETRLDADSLSGVESRISSAAPSRRDPALDAIRGFAIVAMLATHVGPMSRVTALIHLPLWVSAADFFVLTSGFVLGTKGARELATKPPGALHRWLLKRAFKLLCIHYILTLSVLAVHAATGRLDAPDIDGVGGIPRALALVLTLRLQPGDFMNILPLYVVFLAAAPLIFEAIRRKMSLVVLAASAFLWILSQRDPSLVPLPDPRVTPAPFSLAAWQFVFVVGLLAGFHRATLARWLRALGLGFKFLVLLFTAGLFVAAQLDRDVFDAVGWATPQSWLSLLGKQTWGPLHGLYAIGLASIGYSAIDRWLLSRTSRTASPSGPLAWIDTALIGTVFDALQALGRRSLYCFQIHLVFALAASAAGALKWPMWSQDLLVVLSSFALYQFARREIWLRYLPN